MCLRAGEQLQNFLDIARVFPGWGEDVNMVEMWASTAEGEDWPFCVDDVRVRFKTQDETEKEDGPRRWDWMEEAGLVSTAERWL